MALATALSSRRCILRLIASILIATNSSSRAQVFENEVLTGFAQDGGSLYVDNANRPHVSWNHGWTPWPLMYGYMNAAGWCIESPDSLGSTLLPTSLAVDNAGNPHIAYVTYPAYNLGYARKDAGGWHIELVDLPRTVGGPSLDLDSYGNPHICYFANEPVNSRYVTIYARRDGTEWHVEVIDSLDSSGQYVSLKLDGLDRPHAAYTGGFYNGYYPEHCLWYAHRSPSGWQSEIVVAPPDSWPGDPSLALDGSGHPHIAYVLCDGNGCRMRYARRDQSGWHIEDIEGGDEIQSPWGVSLALDSAGYPRMSCYDVTELALIDELFYVYKNATGWNTQYVGWSAWADRTSLAVDNLGLVHITYRSEYDGYDYTHHTDLTYARQTDTTLVHTYAPVLCLWPNDYAPVEIAAMVDSSSLDRYGSVVVPEPEMSEVSLDGSLTDQHYVNMIAAAPRWVEKWPTLFPLDPRLIVHRPVVPSPSRFERFDRVVYARQPVYDAAGAVLQYWFFYPYNRHMNTHEGDWEGIQIQLNTELLPTSITFAGHEWRTTHPWPTAGGPVELVAGTHPKVRVAWGSHASHPMPGVHKVNSLTPTEIARDTTPADSVARILHPGNGAFSTEYSLVVMPKGGGWTEFPGPWGELLPWNTPLPTHEGPTGPAMKRERWTDPREWAEDGRVGEPSQLVVYATPGSASAFEHICPLLMDDENRYVGPHLHQGYANHFGDAVILYALGANDVGTPPIAALDLARIPRGENRQYLFQAGFVSASNVELSFAVTYHDSILGETAVVEYHAVELAAGGSALSQVSSQWPTYELQVDHDGDGNIDATLPPSVNVDPSLSVPILSGTSSPGKIITLSWTVSTGALAYRLYRGSDPDFDSGGGTNLETETTATIHTIDLSGVGEGEQVCFLVRAVGSSQSESYPSNVVITVSGLAGEGPRSEKPVRLGIGPLFPNPAAGTVSIPFQIPSADDVLLRIYDLSGRELRTLRSGHLEAGCYVEKWDGNDSSGRRVPAGLYFCRLQSGQAQKTERMVVIQ